MKALVVSHLYRLDYHLTSFGIDEWDEPYPGHGVALAWTTFQIIKRTPKGVWINVDVYPFYRTKKRFVLLTAKKQFASETKERAKQAFIRRKEIQMSIYQSKIKDIKNALYKVENFK